MRLIRELEEAAREHARTEDYVFVGPVTVSVVEDAQFRKGRFEIISEVKEGPSGLPAASVVTVDGERVVLGPEPVTIGRLPESTIVVNDPNASRRHAEIRRVGQRCGRGRPQFDQRDQGERGHRHRARAQRRRSDRHRNHRPSVRDVVITRI